MAVYQTNSPEETEQLARCVGEKLRAGDIVAYRGGMGMGKTAFTRGLAAGMGIGVDCVSSPTFAIVNEYRKNGQRLCHFDMYRIDSYDALYSTGFFDYLNEGAVLAIEWSENIEGLDILPKDTIWIAISQTGDLSRTIEIEGGERFENLGC